MKSDKQRDIDVMKMHLREWLRKERAHESLDGSGGCEQDRPELTGSTNAINNPGDVINHLESLNMDAEDFFIEYGYKLITLGLPADDVPKAVVSQLGDVVAEQTWAGGSWVNVYAYDGKYFVLNEVDMTVYDDEDSACRAAGIADTRHDEISHSIRFNAMNC